MNCEFISAERMASKNNISNEMYIEAHIGGMHSLGLSGPVK
jgi:hypothetical protein